MIQVPPTQFKGYLRQVNIGKLDDVGRLGMRLAFSLFGVDAPAILRRAEELAEKYPSIDAIYAQQTNHRRYADDEALDRGRWRKIRPHTSKNLVPGDRRSEGDTIRSRPLVH